MANNDLIETVSVPSKLRKRTTLAKVTYFDTVKIYENRVEALSGSQQMTWFYKDYNGIDIIRANMNSQFSQIVFLTGVNSKNRALGLDIGGVQNRNAIADSNRMIFCGGMFSWSDANSFATSLGGKIRKAMDAYKNSQDEDEASSSVSVADEIKKFKELMDEGVITEEEFNAKKKQLLGL